MKLDVTFTDDRGLQFTGTVSGTFCPGCKQTRDEPGEEAHIEIDQLEIESVAIPGDDSKGSKHAMEMRPDFTDKQYGGWCREVLDANTEAIHEQAMESLADQRDGQREAAAESRDEMRRERLIG